MEKKKVQI